MNSYNQYEYRAIKKTISPFGAIIYAIAAAVLGAFSVLCLRTNGEEALYGFMCPLFLFGAGYFATVLAVHKKTAAFIFSCAASLIASAALTLNPLVSIVCLSAFLAAWTVSVCLDRSDMTQSGIMLGGICIYAVFFAWALVILCTQKYGGVSTDVLLHAYDSFCNVMLEAPRAALVEMKETYTDPAYAEAITSYEKTIAQLSESLKKTVYFVPSAFLFICSVGSFITVSCAKKHRRMQLMADNAGRFSLSIVSAVIYLLSYLVSFFTDPISAVGITVATVSIVPGLGLALVGFTLIYSRIKLHPSRPLYTVLLALAIASMTSLAITVFSLVGAYRTIADFVKERKKDR